MAVGLGFGDNTTASVITRGLAETARLAMAQGANPLTLMGLAGLGDLVHLVLTHTEGRTSTVTLSSTAAPLAAALGTSPRLTEGLEEIQAGDVELRRAVGLDPPQLVAQGRERAGHRSRSRRTETAWP